MGNKSRIFTLTGVLILAMLLAAALFLPEYYFRNYDFLQESKVNYQDAYMEVTPVVTYPTFSDKLRALAEYEAEGLILHAVRTQEVKDESTRKQLQDAVREELPYLTKCFSEYGLFHMEDEPEIESCDLYMIYSENEKVQGMGFWRLDCRTGKDFSMTVLLDTEFQKIYAYTIRQEDPADEILSEMESIWNMKYYWDLEYIWAENMAKYYEAEDEVLDHGLSDVDWGTDCFMLQMEIYFQNENLVDVTGADTNGSSLSESGAADSYDVMAQRKEKMEVAAQNTVLPAAAWFGVDPEGIQYLSGGICSMFGFLEN